MAGRVPHSHNRRYYAAGRLRALYLVEADEFVKLGTAKNVPHRLVQLHREFLLQRQSLRRFAVFTGSLQEQACIDAMCTCAEQLPHRLEYFRGIDFDAAVGVMLQTLSPVSVRVFPWHDPAPATG